MFYAVSGLFLNMASYIFIALPKGHYRTRNLQCVNVVVH